MNRLKELREDRDIYQKQIAKYLNVKISINMSLYASYYIFLKKKI